MKPKNSKLKVRHRIDGLETSGVECIQVTEVRHRIDGLEIAL